MREVNITIIAAETLKSKWTVLINYKYKDKLDATCKFFSYLFAFMMENGEEKGKWKLMPLVCISM